MAVSAEAIQSASRIFSQRIPLCVVIPPEEVTDRLNLTKSNKSVDGVTKPLLTSVRNAQWFSIDNDRILIELRKPHITRRDFGRKIKSIKGVDFDDCMASATEWHRREQELMQELFGVPVVIGKDLYEKSKVTVPGKVEGEKRYTPRLNLALLTTFTELRGQRMPEEKAYDETLIWREAINNLIQNRGEVAVERLAVDPQIMNSFIGNSISRFVYRDFVGAIFGPGGPESLNFVATRGKIEGPLGQVYKVHTSGVMKKNTEPEMVIYTNDIKAETLIYLSKLLKPEQIKNKDFYLFDDNTDEINPYANMAKRQGLNNIWVVQVGHPGAKRKGDKLDMQPARVIGRENAGETVLKYYSIRDDLPLTRRVLFPN